MDIVLLVHSLVRWAIIVVAVIAIVKFVIGWAGDQSFTGMDRGLAAAFSGLMDLQVALGLIYLIWNGLAVTGFPMYRILHAVTMLIAAAVGHLPSRFKNLNDKLRFQYSAFALIGSLVLVGIGIWFLRH